MPKIKKALISLTDKTGIVAFSEILSSTFGVEILSTGGTARKLREGGVPVIDVSEYTGFPEMLDGRVKTLHPMIHGGLLGLRDNFEHIVTMEKHGIKPIDLVVVNLYPFEETVAKDDVTLKEAIENIDIGGSTMLRAAAKNFTDVTVVVDPADYDLVLAEMMTHGGETTLQTRFRLAKKVFEHTHRYERAIDIYLQKIDLPNS